MPFAGQVPQFLSDLIVLLLFLPIPLVILARIVQFHWLLISATYALLSSSFIYVCVTVRL
jgi:hypothetical protein